MDDVCCITGTVNTV